MEVVICEHDYLVQIAHMLKYVSHAEHMHGCHCFLLT
jgi:hypothetical protein